MISGGGSLRSIVILSERVATSDNAGNWQDGWVRRMTRRAQIIPRAGNEALEATRSEGRGTVIIRVRSDPDTRKITTDWKATNGLSGTEYNVRAVRDPAEGGPDHGRWLDLAAEYGRASG